MNANDEKRAKAELEAALQTGDARAVSKAILSNVWPLYSTHYRLLTSAVESLPNAELERNPVLRMLHPMTPVIARTIRPSEPVLDPEYVRSLGPDERDLLTLAQMIAGRVSGDEVAALHFAERLRQRITRVRVESRDRTDGPLWYLHHQLASTLLWADDSAGALQELATSRQLASLSLQPDAERIVLGRVALAHAIRGSLDDADQALGEARRHPEVTPAHVNAATATEAAAAALLGAARMSDDVDERLAELEPYDSIEITWPFALLARARVLLAREDPHDAIEAALLARNSHPPQPGSFATDVISSVMIYGSVMAGDLTQAHLIRRSEQPRGVLTRLALAQLALVDGELDEATRLKRSVFGDHSLGPGPRAQATLLAAWAEWARTGDLNRHTAAQVARLATKTGNRRIFASIPRQLVDCVRMHLAPAEADSLDEALAGLAIVEHRARPQLTSGEYRVLQALPVHDTVASIAAALHVSPNTIKTQLRVLYRKLGCSTREEAVQIANRMRLVPATRGP